MIKDTTCQCETDWKPTASKEDDKPHEDEKKCDQPCTADKLQNCGGKDGSYSLFEVDPTPEYFDMQLEKLLSSYKNSCEEGLERIFINIDDEVKENIEFFGQQKSETINLKSSTIVHKILKCMKDY